MLSLFHDMNYIVSTYIEELDNDHKQFYHNVHQNILVSNEEEEHLPTPVY